MKILGLDGRVLHWSIFAGCSPTIPTGEMKVARELSGPRFVKMPPNHT